METVSCANAVRPTSEPKPSMDLRPPRATIWMSLGCNVSGAWGTCQQSLQRALVELQTAGLRIVACSHTYRTRPVGLARQPAFLNVAIGIEGSIAPGALLRLAKRIERQAGRRGIGARGGPRPLDVDVLDFNGQRIGRAGSIRVTGQLLLPHPEIARRGFVLVPLAEAAPGWRHPYSRLSAATLLKRRPELRRGVVAFG